MKYSKGPWFLDFDTISTEPKRSGNIIAMIKFGGIDNPQANARLIAAAPQLYEACKASCSLAVIAAMLDKHQEHKDEVQEILAKIDKALDLADKDT